ncbi:uncharacterized protein LOC129603444 isoform X2 [Betta splendens]|uniref:Uncharacterized protein LOC129603444 isoform X2 n=1 Tax=Betta splendens TaxID=158456 RepID=A0A9W2XFF8_BETSP|nr:uncharacterized protein LOC129603444 isoform X2 [Betta splendens]
MERHLPPRIWELWTRFRRWSRGGRQRWQPEGEVAVHGRPPRRWRTRFERATSHVQEVGPPTSGIEVPRFDLPSYLDVRLPLYTDLFPPHSPPRFPVPSAIPSSPPPPYSPPHSPVPSSVPSTPPPPYSPVPSRSFAAPHSPPRSPVRPSSVPSTPPPPYSPVPSRSFAPPHSPPRSPVRPSSVPSTPPPPYSPVPSCSPAPPLSPPCSFAPSSSIPPSPPAPSPLVPPIVAPSELPCVPDAGLPLSPVIQDSGSTVEGTSEDLAVGETNEAPSSGSSSSTPGRVLVAGCVWHWGLRVQFSMVVGWTFLSPWRLSSAPGRAVDPPMQVALASGRFRKEKTMRAPGDEEKELQKETTGNETTDLDHGPAVQGDVKRIAGNSAAQLHSVQLWRMETTDTIGLPGEKLSPVCIEAQCSSFASLLPPASGPDRGEPPSANHIEEVSLSLLPLCCWVWETLHIISGVDLHL